jgi:hypothetical protein
METQAVKDYQFLRLLAVALVAAALGAGSLSYSQETAETHISKLSFPGATPPDSQTQSTDTTGPPKAATDSDWHLVLSPYLWLPGVHGTAGVVPAVASIHASAADLLSNFRFGLMGTADLRHKRVLLPLDIMWVRLGDDKALPALGSGAVTANVKASEFMLTPKIGYRLIDQEKLKVDALTGFRYWHLGQNLSFSPSVLGLNFSDSQNWVDPLVGGRIAAPLSPRAEVTIAGDVGGWGVGSQLEYQIVGLLGYRVKPNLTLQAGYRYLDVNYRSGRTIFDVAMSGVVLGVSINLK